MPMTVDEMVFRSLLQLPDLVRKHLFGTIDSCELSKIGTLRARANVSLEIDIPFLCVMILGYNSPLLLC